MILQTCAVKAAPKAPNEWSRRGGANQCACGPIARRVKAGRRMRTMTKEGFQSR